MAKTTYNLHLKGYVGGWDFDSDYVDYVLNKNTDKEVSVLIDSLGGQFNTALSISSAFRRHGNVHVHFVGLNVAVPPLSLPWEPNASQWTSLRSTSCTSAHSPSSSGAA